MVTVLDWLTKPSFEWIITYVSWLIYGMNRDIALDLTPVSDRD